MSSATVMDGRPTIPTKGITDDQAEVNYRRGYPMRQCKQEHYPC